jgi:hypothetical protein
MEKPAIYTMTSGSIVASVTAEELEKIISAAQVTAE